MPLSRQPPLGQAVADLGLGDMLSLQVADETEEQRRKRMEQMQNRALAPAGSPATLALFGGMGGLSR